MIPFPTLRLSADCQPYLLIPSSGSLALPLQTGAQWTWADISKTHPDSGAIELPAGAPGRAPTQPQGRSVSRGLGALQTWGSRNSKRPKESVGRKEGDRLSLFVTEGMTLSENNGEPQMGTIVGRGGAGWGAWHTHKPEQDQHGETGQNTAIEAAEQKEGREWEQLFCIVLAGLTANKCLVGHKRLVRRLWPLPTHTHSTLHTTQWSTQPKAHTIVGRALILWGTIQDLRRPWTAGSELFPFLALENSI